MAKRVQHLIVIYDGDCILCRRSAHWLDHSRTHVPVRTIAARHPDALAEYGDIPGYGDNMVVVADDGRAWVGPPDAYLVVLWSVRGTRMLSYLLALPGMRSIASRVFRTVAGNRHLVADLRRSRCAACDAATNR